jgi:hypothetical protein
MQGFRKPGLVLQTRREEFAHNLHECCNCSGCGRGFPKHCGLFLLTTFEIPAAIKSEHEKLHADLSAATKLRGATGQAAKRVAAILHEHLVSDEELAMPPLALLAPIAEGRVTPDMRSVVALTDRLKSEMPRMLTEHKAIVQALDELGRAAAAEHHPEVSRFVEELTCMLRRRNRCYPAAIVVGEYLKLKFSRCPRTL